MIKPGKLYHLPTKDSSSIVLNSILGLHISTNTKSNVKEFQNQHVYLTSDDKIKDGEWFINTFGASPKLEKRVGDWTTCFNHHKVIAATDKSLYIPMGDDDVCIFDVPFPTIHEDDIKWYVEGQGKMTDVGIIYRWIVDRTKSAAESEVVFLHRYNV